MSGFAKFLHVFIGACLVIIAKSTPFDIDINDDDVLLLKVSNPDDVDQMKKARELKLRKIVLKSGYTGANDQFTLHFKDDDSELSVTRFWWWYVCVGKWEWKLDDETRDSIGDDGIIHFNSVCDLPGMCYDNKVGIKINTLKVPLEALQDDPWDILTINVNDHGNIDWNQVKLGPKHALIVNGYDCENYPVFPETTVKYKAHIQLKNSDGNTCLADLSRIHFGSNDDECHKNCEIIVEVDSAHSTQQNIVHLPQTFNGIPLKSMKKVSISHNIVLDNPKELSQISKRYLDLSSFMHFNGKKLRVNEFKKLIINGNKMARELEIQYIASLLDINYDGISPVLLNTIPSGSKAEEQFWNWWIVSGWEYKDIGYHSLGLTYNSGIITAEINALESIDGDSNEYPVFKVDGSQENSRLLAYVGLNRDPWDGILFKDAEWIDWSKIHLSPKESIEIDGYNVDDFSNSVFIPMRVKQKLFIHFMRSNAQENRMNTELVDMSKVLFGTRNNDDDLEIDLRAQETFGKVRLIPPTSFDKIPLNKIKKLSVFDGLELSIWDVFKLADNVVDFSGTFHSDIDKAIAKILKGLSGGGLDILQFWENLLGNGSVSDEIKNIFLHLLNSIISGKGIIPGLPKLELNVPGFDPEQFWHWCVAHFAFNGFNKFKLLDGIHLSGNMFHVELPKLPGIDSHLGLPMININLPKSPHLLNLLYKLLNNDPWDVMKIFNPFKWKIDWSKIFLSKKKYLEIDGFTIPDSNIPAILPPMHISHGLRIIFDCTQDNQRIDMSQVILGDETVHEFDLDLICNDDDHQLIIDALPQPHGDEPLDNINLKDTKNVVLGQGVDRSTLAKHYKDDNGVWKKQEVEPPKKDKLKPGLIMLIVGLSISCIILIWLLVICCRNVCLFSAANTDTNATTAEGGFGINENDDKNADVDPFFGRYFGAIHSWFKNPKQPRSRATPSTPAAPAPAQEIP